MLSFSQLATLYQTTRGSKVLSVYVDGTATDPAHRTWHVELDNALARIRHDAAGTTHAERLALNDSIEHLELACTTLREGIGAPGWVAFVTAQGIEHASALPSRVATSVHWTDRIWISPYVRLLQHSRSAVIALIDARKTVLYRYQDGEFEQLDVLRAHHEIGDLTHMGAPPTRGFHSGTRGSAGREAAQRALLEGTSRMLVEVAERIKELARDDVRFLIGGIRRVTRRLTRRLPHVITDRMLLLDSLDVHATPAEISAAARHGLAILRERVDLHALDDVVEQAGAHTLGVLGAESTARAITLQGVRALYLTPRYCDAHQPEVEELVRAAIAQDAFVEEVGGDAAIALDRIGGIAASLRFRPSALDPAGTAMPSQNSSSLSKWDSASALPASITARR